MMGGKYQSIRGRSKRGIDMENSYTTIKISNGGVKQRFRICEKCHREVHSVKKND
jgi:hypothetical protein